MNNKIIMIISIILLVIVVIGGIKINNYYQLKKKGLIMDGGNTTGYSDDLWKLINLPKTYDKLLKIEYSSSGNMDNNIDEINIDINKQILETKYRSMNGEPIKVKEYVVSDTDIKKLLDDIENYNFPEWRSIKEYEEIQELDGPTTIITFIYNNEEIGGSKLEHYTIDFHKKIPKDARKVLNEFLEKMKILINDEKKIKETTE